MPNNKISYSYFNSVKDTSPKHSTVTFRTFSETFKKPIISQDKKKAACINFSLHENKGANISLRKITSVSQISGIMLDIDNKEEVKITINKAIKILKSLCICFIVYTSFNHTQKKPRFRIVIPFNSAISPEYILETYNFFNNLLNFSIDICSKNPAQLYFLPSCNRENKSHYQSYNNKSRKFFDPISKGIKRNTLTIPRINNPSKKCKLNQLNFKSTKVNLDELKIDINIEELIISGDTSKYNSRSEAIFDVVKILIEHKQSNGKIISILLDHKYGISERCLEIGPKAIMHDIERIRKKIDKSNPVHENVEPHYKPTKSFTPMEAQDYMNQKISSWFENANGDRAIEASAGIGKTTSVVNTIINSTKNIEYYVQRIELAEEIRKKLIEKDPKFKHKAQVVRGRTHKDINGETLCFKPTIVEKLSKFGLNIYKGLCNKSKDEKCEYFESCPYLAQNKPGIQVKILTHAHLGLGRSLIDSDIPELAIIDETYFSNLIKTEMSTLRNIKKQLNSNPLSISICYSLKNKKPLLDYLRKKYKSSLFKTINNSIIELNTETPNINPNMSENEVNSELLTINYKTTQVLILLKTLYMELNKFKKRKESITIRYVKNKVEISTRKEIIRFTDQGKANDINIPVLCIDADFNINISKVFFPNIKKLTIKIKRNTTVTQVISTRNSNTRFCPRVISDQEKNKEDTINKKTQIARLQRVINKLSEYKTALIIGSGKIVGNSNKGIKPLIDLPHGSAFEHFGNLRGIDKHKNMEIVIIIGRWQFPSHALESMAASLWWDNSHPPELDQELVSEIRGYRSKNKFGVNVMVHPDKKVQTVNEAFKEKESLQAIDRIRLVHNIEPKQVYLLSNIVLDIDVDHFVTWKELYNEGDKIEQAFIKSACNVMPLEAKYLKKHYSDIFKTEGSAKQTVSRFIKKRVNGFMANNSHEGGGKKVTKKLLSDKFYILYLHTNCHLIKYRVTGAKGAAKTAIVKENTSISQIRASLTKIHGCKIKFFHFPSLNKKY